jgi:8-oxo-dGTP pyrophosphatase MutT (NUDIX family)
MLGGHVNDGETVEEAASREWLEETSIAHGEMIGITGSYANGKGHVLVAVQFKPIMLAQWKQAILCPENSDFGMWCPANYDQPPLGFPIHQRIAQSWALEYA